MRYATKLPAATSSSSGPSNQYVRRWRRLDCIGVLDHVAESAHGADPDPGVVQLGAQARDVDLYRVVGERIVPAAHRLQHVLLADHLSDPHQQILENRPFPRGEVEDFLPDAGAPRDRVDIELAEAQRRTLDDLAAPDEGANARLQLGKREGLGDVVVRAEVEAAHAVRLRVVGGEYQDAARVAVAAKLPQN